MRFHLGSRPRWRYDVNGNGFLGMMMTMISHHKKRDNRTGPDRVSEYTFMLKSHKYHKLNQWSLQEADEVPDEDFSDMNPSSPSAEPPPSAEQRRPSRRDERPRSRKRTPPHSSSHDADESSANRGSNRIAVSDRERSPQEQEASR